MNKDILQMLRTAITNRSINDKWSVTNHSINGKIESPGKLMEQVKVGHRK